MPTWRIGSATGRPNSASFTAAAIYPTETRFFSWLISPALKGKCVAKLTRPLDHFRHATSGP
jgi:hypothetical protein